MGNRTKLTKLYLSQGRTLYIIIMFRVVKLSKPRMNEDTVHKEDQYLNLFVGTYGVHRMIVTHHSHLGHIVAPPRRILLWSNEFNEHYKIADDMVEGWHMFEQCEVNTHIYT